MADRPILFSGPMIKALIAGRKTQTRRLCKDQPPAGVTIIRKTIRPFGKEPYHAFERRTKFGNFGGEVPVKISRGDRLWVRETHQFRGGDYGDSDGAIDWFRCYGPEGAPDNWDPIFPTDFEPSSADGVREMTEADEQEDGVIGYVTKRRPGIHMPRWASRMTLIVTDVRVERLQDISREDAIAEGLTKMPLAPPLAVEMGCDWGFDGDTRYGSPVSAYASLWNHINGAGAWEANPWVVAYTFRVIKQNIDQIEKVAA